MAGAELGTAYISVSLGTGNLSGQIRKAFAGAGNVGASAGGEAGSGFAMKFGSLVKGALVAATAGTFGKYIADAAQASDATDKFVQTMNFAGLDTKSIDKAKNAAKSYADQTVYDLPTIQKTIAQLASNGVKDYTGLTQAAGNLNAVAGGNAETFKSVSMVMTQTAGAGKLTAENWNQLSDAIPGASGPIQEALRKNGAFTGNFRDAMSEGAITSDEFNKALLELGSKPVAVQAAASTKTFEGALGSLNAAINGQLMSALDKIKPAFTGAVSGIANGVGMIGPAIQGISDILFKGDFTGNFAKAFHVQEDSALVDFLFNVRDAFIPVIDTAKTFGPLIQTVFTGLGPQVMQLFQAFSPLNLIFQAITPVLPMLVSLFSMLAITIGQQLGVILPIVTTLVSQLATIIGGVFIQIMPSVVAVVGALGTALGMVAPVFATVVAAIYPLIAQLVGQLAPILVSFVNTIVPVVIQNFLMMAGAIMPLVQALLGVLVPVIRALMPVVMTVFSVITNVISNAMQIVQGIIKVVTGIISGNWSQVWAGIRQVLAGVWNTIGAIIGGAMGILRSLISGGLQALFSIWSGIWNMVSGFLGSAWGGIVHAVSGGVGRVMGVITSLPGKIIGALAGAGGWLVSVGVNIIQGLINGIGSMMGAIGRAILSIVPEAIRGPFEQALGIHSPSRVFLGYGINIGQGLINGTEKMMPKIKSTMQGLVELPALPTSSSYASTASAAQLSSVVGGQQNIFNMQPMEPEATASAVARRLAMQIA